jgi:hypothetical protein
MEIIINANDDTIELKQCKAPFKIQCEYPHQTLNLLDEIFNRLYGAELNSRAINFGITLIYVNENRVRTVGEW